MKIWLIRHGETNLNKFKLMQGRTDEPLNDRGIEQALIARELVKDIKFDSVYASPLDRAIETASIVADIPREKVKIDERITEVNFGKYELHKYSRLGIKMSLYWALPEIFPAPIGVENTESMALRSRAFLSELEKMEYDNILIASHGGILRALNGYLMDRKNGLRWRPKMSNCEIRVYSSINGKHKFLSEMK